MRPANSYQSPSMTPPDEPDYELDGTRTCVIPEGNHACGSYAVVQDHFDLDLCVEHFEEAAKEEAEEAKTERQIDRLEDDGYEYPKGYDGR